MKEKVFNSTIFQDELEFGYIDAPHHRFPVVLDSPRDGELMDFPYNELLVSDGFRFLFKSNVWRYIMLLEMEKLFEFYLNQIHVFRDVTLDM